MKKQTVLLIAPYRGHRITYESILSEQYHVVTSSNLPTPDSIPAKRAYAAVIINQWKPIPAYQISAFAETSKLPVLVAADMGQTELLSLIQTNPYISIVYNPVSIKGLLAALEKIIIQTPSPSGAAQTARIQTVQSALKSAYKSAAFRQKIDNAIEYIKNHYDEITNFKRIADTFDLNYASMRLAIQHKTGKSPQEYLKAIRLEKMLELIQFTRLSAEEICIEVGLRDTPYAEKLFFNAHGVYIEDCIEQYRNRQ